MLWMVGLSFALGLGFVLAGLRSKAQLVEQKSVATALAIPSDYNGYAPPEDGPGWLTVWTERRARGVRKHRNSGGLSSQLEGIRIPLRVSEAIAAAILLTIVLGGVAWVVSDSWVIAVGTLVAVPFILKNRLGAQVRKRRKLLEEQMPEALSVLSSSLRAGHTLHRAMEAYALSGDAPLAEEFRQVIAETHLGNSIVVAVQNFAERVEVPEAAWLARAISIQYTVGGKLADLLDALAEITYGRQELSREVAALTAEGRASAWLLGMLPPALLVMIQLSNPGYLDPMYSGWGLAALGGCAVSIAIGVMAIRRMIDFEE